MTFSDAASLILLREHIDLWVHRASPRMDTDPLQDWCRSMVHVNSS